MTIRTHPLGRASTATASLTVAVIAVTPTKRAAAPDLLLDVGVGDKEGHRVVDFNLIAGLDEAAGDADQGERDPGPGGLDDSGMIRRRDEQDLGFHLKYSPCRPRVRIGTTLSVAIDSKKQAATSQAARRPFQPWKRRRCR